MKNALLLVAFMLAICTSKAQNKRFMFGANVFPAYSLQVQSNEDNIRNESNYAQGKTSISTHVFVEYRHNDRMAFGAGFGYQNYGASTARLTLPDPAVIQPSVNTAPGTDLTPTHKQWALTIHNFEVPFFLKVYGTQRFYASLGTSVLLNIGSTRDVIYFMDEAEISRRPQSGTIADPSLFNLTANFGLGYEILKDRKVSWSIQPSAQMGLFDSALASSLSSKFLSVGVISGVRF